MINITGLYGMCNETSMQSKFSWKHIQMERGSHSSSFDKPQALKADSFHISEAPWMLLSWSFPTRFMVSSRVSNWISRASIHVLKESLLPSFPWCSLLEPSLLPGFLTCTDADSCGSHLQFVLPSSLLHPGMGMNISWARICAVLVSAAHIMIKKKGLPISH